MAVETFSVDYDHRLNCYVVSARSSYKEYLRITEGAEANLEIQRSIIKGRKAYETLREDLKRGCVLPPVVLSIQDVSLPEIMKSPMATLYPDYSAQLVNELAPLISDALPEKVQIIDGLQRTNAIRAVADSLDGETKVEFLDRPLRFEVWMNIPFYALAYRMLLLNAGQKPMSMKHQIEILSDSLRAELSGIADIELLRGIDKRRRTRPGQFHLSVLAGAFQAWIQQQPNVDLRNALTEQLLADEAVTNLGHQLFDRDLNERDDFKSFVQWLNQLDQKLGVDYVNFLGNETVIHAMAAAFSQSFAKQELKERATKAMDGLLAEIENCGIEAAFAPGLFDEMRRQIDPKKRNVGDATRDMVYRAITEYIISAGTKNMRDCWTFASTYI